MCGGFTDFLTMQASTASMRSPVLILGLGLAVSALAAVHDGALAQSADAAAQSREKLQSLQQSLQQSEAEKEKIRGEVQALAGERSKLMQALLEASNKTRALETSIVDGERRLGELADAEDNLKASLASRRGVLAEVLAALQRLGRQPPPVLLVRPDAALESVRSAILLGALLPELRVEAEALASDLKEMVRLRDQISEEKQRSAKDLAALGEERARLEALVDERQRQQTAREQDYAAEQKHARDLAKEAQTLEGLIARLEKDGRGRKAPAGPPPGQQPSDNLAALQDTSRLAPAMPFEEAKGLLPLPVSGRRMHDFGAPDGLGGSEHGATIAARPGAQVTAPCDGWVVYAGPFRSYGQLLILDAGGGYHVLLAGMERINVELKQFVLTGEPVAVMGGTQTASMTTTISEPALYVEFRKDGTSIDPAPWWSDATAEKVGG